MTSRLMRSDGEREGFQAGVGRLERCLKSQKVIKPQGAQIDLFVDRFFLWLLSCVLLGLTEQLSFPEENMDDRYI
jgi:hypothetical protein